jgi:hypothetical protein
VAAPVSERQELSEWVSEWVSELESNLWRSNFVIYPSGSGMIMEAVSVHRAPATTSLQLGGKVRTHKLDFHILKESIRKHSFYRVVEQCLNCSIARFVIDLLQALLKRKGKKWWLVITIRHVGINLHCQHAGIRKSCLLLTVSFYFSLIQLLLITINIITWLSMRRRHRDWKHGRWCRPHRQDSFCKSLSTLKGKLSI